MPAKPAPPSDAQLTASLGKTKPLWDALLAAAVELDPKAKPTWKYYASLKGWRCIVAAGGRNVVHMRPDDGSFLTAFGLNDAALHALEKEESVPAALLTEAHAAKGGTEGRPLRIPVASRHDLAQALAVLRAKMAFG